jgi:hypothetical protein
MDLLQFVKNHCAKHNIKFVQVAEDFIPYPGSKLPCAGYFVAKDNDPELGIAMGLKDWHEVLLHEFCHSNQWLEGHASWINNYLKEDEANCLGITAPNSEALDVLDMWTEGKIELSAEDVTEFTNRAIEVERDCEERTCALGKEFWHEFDAKNYARKANAYLRYYKYVELRRTWNTAGGPPYSDDIVVAAQLDNFEQDYSAPLTSVEVKLFQDFMHRGMQKSLKKRSGEVQIDSKLVSFLYELMRDHLPSGVVEKLVMESTYNIPTQYTNGWLAKYAEDLANRLS